MISVIVPILNEEKNIDNLISNLKCIRSYNKEIMQTTLEKVDLNFEVIISDGGSLDSSINKIKEASKNIGFNIIIINSIKGRGQQLNEGIKNSSGEILFFLHADSKVSYDALEKIYKGVKDGASWGCLKLKMDSNKLIYRIGEFVSNRRSRNGICFGDQGIYMTRNHLEKYGGFLDIPIMEDYEYSKKMMKYKIIPTIIDTYITTSVRRFEEKGPILMGLKMYMYRYEYDKGKDAKEINKKY